MDVKSVIDNSQKHFYLFNSTCELAIANGSPTYVAPLNLSTLENDLKVLPFLLAHSDDWVCLINPISEAFIERMNTIGFKTPHFCHLKEIKENPPTNLTPTPWGWSPAVYFELKQVNKHWNLAHQYSPLKEWNSEHRFFFSRLTTHRFLEILKTESKSHSLIAFEPSIVIQDAKEIHALLDNNQNWVFKSIWSSSGRGIRMVSESCKHDNQWLDGSLRQNGFLIAEPYYQKIIDFSFHFYLHPDGKIDYNGISFFKTDKWQYAGSYINDYPEEWSRIETEIGGVERLNEMAELVVSAIKKMSFENHYYGSIGIDALIHQTKDGVKIQPCVEINFRHTMGRVTLAIQEKIAPTAKGFWEIKRCKDISADFETNLQLENNKLLKGSTFLTPNTPDNQFVAIIQLK